MLNDRYGVLRTRYHIKQGRLRPGGQMPAVAPRMPAMGDRISRGRKSYSTDKGLTALCCGWRYIFEIIEIPQ